MNKLVIVLLVIPLLIVMATKDPQGVGHLVEIIIALGAKLLNATAVLLNHLVGSHLCGSPSSLRLSHRRGERACGSGRSSVPASQRARLPA